MVDGNIGSDSFVAMVSFGGDNGDTVEVEVDEAGDANKASAAFVIEGIDLKSATTPVTITVADFTALLDEQEAAQALAAMTKDMIKVSQTRNETSLEVVITPTEGIELPEEAQDDAGRLPSLSTV